MNLLSLQEIICLFKGSVTPWVALFLCLSLLIEITPIKLNPWSWFAKKIGRAFNGEIMKEISELKTKMGEEIGTLKTDMGNVDQKVEDIKKDVIDIREEAKEREATNRRTRILEFGDEILHGVDYSKEHWDQILLDVTEYENYCDMHPHYMNHVAIATIKHIKHVYEKHLEEDSFL